MADRLLISLIIRAIDQATGPLRKVTNNFQALRTGWTQAQQSFARAAEMRQAAAGVATFAAKAREAIAAPINAFEEFQAGMSAVRAVSRGITEDEFTALVEKAKELGATTRYTASQAAEAMHFLGMAGFDAAQQMEAVPSMLNLATAASTDLGRTSDVVSDLLDSFGMTAADTGKLTDALAITITGANVTLETLFETMKLLGPIADDLKIPLEEVASISGVLGSAGIKGSLAGTAMRASLNRLLKPTDAAAAHLKDLKVEVEDADGNMRPFVLILDEVGKAMTGMGTRARGAIISEVFGIRAQSSVSKLIKAIDTGRVSDFADEIRNSTGAAAEMARIMDDNARGATIRMESAIDGLNIAIGEQLEPELTSLKETVTEIVQGMTEWARQNPRLTKAIALTVGVVALLATALAGIMFTFAALTSAKGIVLLAAGFTKTLVPALLMVTKAFIAFSVSLMTNPIFLVVAAVIALASAVVLLTIYWKEFEAWWVGMWERFKEAPLLVKYILAGLLGPLLLLYSPIIIIAGLARKIIDNWTPIKAFFADLWTSITNGVSRPIIILAGLARTIIDAWTPIKAFFAVLWTSITNGVSRAVTAMQLLFDAASEAIATIRPIFETAGAVGGAIGGFAKERIADVDDVIFGPSEQQRDANLRVQLEVPEGFGVRVADAEATGFNMELDTGFTMDTP